MLDGEKSWLYIPLQMDFVQNSQKLQHQPMHILIGLNSVEYRDVVTYRETRYQDLSALYWKITLQL